MKITLIILVFLPLFTFGQNAIISTTKTNLLYYGLDNPLKIVVNNISNKDFILKTLSQKVEIKENSNEYLIKPYFTGIAHFQIINKLDLSIIDTFDLKIINVPDPIISFHLAGWEGMQLQKDYIIVSNDIWDNFNIKYEIIKFEMYAKRDTSTIFNLVNNGAIYNESLLKEINNLNKGDKIYIGDVWLKVDNKILVYLTYKSYKIN